MGNNEWLNSLEHSIPKNVIVEVKNGNTVSFCKRIGDVGNVFKNHLGKPLGFFPEQWRYLNTKAENSEQKDWYRNWMEQEMAI